MSPTQRALKELREQGYRAHVVEKWNAFAKRRIDLFDCIDVIGIRPGEIIGIQATGGSGGNRAAREAKCIEKGQDWLKAGGKLEVWAWRKLKGHRSLQLDRRVICRLSDAVSEADSAAHDEDITQF